MNPAIDIKANEHATIRVFAVNKAPSEITDTLATMPKADLARQLLGDPHLDTSSTEIFPVSDLTGMGLGAYLSEGYAVQPKQIARDRSRLDALDGYVLLLFSDSFAGKSARLAPGEALTLIGTYTEVQPASSAGPIAAESAKPYTGPAPAAKQAPKRSPNGSAAIVVLIAALLGVALWWLL